MAVRGDRHSQLVSWLKIIFPLMALALLSTLFLLSRGSDPETVIPFAEKEVQDRLRDQQVTGPFYSGTTADGDEISFSAEVLSTAQDQAGSNRAQTVEVIIDTQDGGGIMLKADSAEFSLTGDKASLTGDVIITSSAGYRMTSDLLESSLSALNLKSPGPVEAAGPFGTLSAGSMALTGGQGPQANHFLFMDGVKLVYTPNTMAE